MSILALEALAEQLLTIVLAVLVAGSVSLSAAAVVWLRIRHAIDVHHHATPSLAPH